MYENIETSPNDFEPLPLRERLLAISRLEQDGSLGTLRKLQIERLTPLVHQYSDEPLAQLMLLFSVGLSTLGSVSSKNPSTSITRRYTKEVLEALCRHSEAAVRLPKMDARELGEMYLKWIAEGHVRKDISGGLSALDMHLVRAGTWTGACDPVGVA